MKLYKIYIMTLDELITHLLNLKQGGYGEYKSEVTAVEIDFENKTIDLRY